MADQDVAQAFQNFVAEMGNVSTSLGTQGVNQIYLHLKGESKKFKEGTVHGKIYRTFEPGE